MPGGAWVQRMRRLGENTDARDTLDRVRSRAASSNPFAPAAPPRLTTEPPPPTSGYDPRVAAAPSATDAYNPFLGSAPSPATPVQPPPTCAGSMQDTAPLRPLAVKLASGALLAAAILTLVIGGVGAYAVTELRTTVGRVLELDQTGTATLLASGYADDTQVVLMIISVAVAAVMAVGYLLVAHAIWRGRSWPRALSPFLVILSTPAIFIGPLAVGIVVAGAIATAAVWTPGARAYPQRQAAFRARARARR